MREVIAFGILFISIATGAVFRDVLYLREGEEVRCNLLEITERKVIVEIPKDTTVSIAEFAIDGVVRLTMTHPRPGDEWETADSIADSLLLMAIGRISEAKKHSDASSVMLYRSVKYSVHSDSSCCRTERQIILILSERAKGVNATRSFFFVAPGQHGALDFCRTVTADGNVFHLDDAALEFAEPNQYYPQYNFLRRMKFAPPRISIDAVIDFQFHIDYNKLDPANPVTEKIVFGWDEPVLYQELEIEFPSEFTQEFVRYYAFEPPMVKLNENSAKMTWRRESIMPYIKEANMAPPEMFLPTVWFGFAIDEAKILRSLSDSLTIALDGSPELDRFIDSFLENAKSPKEKFSRLYEYMNLSFRKTSIYPSDSRWFPSKVSEIFADGIANELDMAVLMCYMLNRAGIESHVVYSSRVFDAAAIAEVPSLDFFNEPLISANIDGEWLFSCPSQKYLPPGIVPDEVVEQQGYWLGKEITQMGEIPANPLDVYTVTETLQITLDENGDAEVKKKSVYGAAAAVPIRYYREIPSRQLDKDFQADVGKFNPGAKLIEYSIIGINSLDSTVIVEEKISAPKLAQLVGKKLIAFQLPELKYGAYGFGLSKRRTPIWKPSPEVLDRVWIIKLPDDFEPYYIPEPVSIKLDSMRYNLKIEYDSRNSTLTAIERSSFSGRLVLPSKYPAFREGIFSRAQSAKNWILLEK